MYPYRVHTLIMLQNLFYRGGWSEEMEMRYGPRKGHMGRRASLKREEPSPAEEEPYCVAIIHEDGSVEFRDP